MDWHITDIAAVLQRLETNVENGLTGAEVTARRAEYGPNELLESGGKQPWRILWEQVSSTMVLILISAAVVSALLGKTTEAIAISAIIVLFAVLGFVQEYRAEQAMAALKKLASPIVRARRNGMLVEVPAQELTPGDVVLLEAGSAVPADARLVESANLRVQEAALTGESEAVEKHTDPLPHADVPLGDRRNMVYMGTAVTYGRGVAVVTATGMNTELGHIATLIQEVAPDETPLQRQLDAVGKTLALFGLAVAALVLVIGVFRGESVEEMFLTAVSVAVAVVPEGLPAVVTITLALGAQRMLRRRALIRKLPAVETLGSVTVICSDKTGTLTENRMTVTIIDVAGHYLELAGTGQHPAPSLPVASEEANVLDKEPPTVGLVLVAGALCNDASLQPDPETGRYLAVGDPTEGALLVAARQAGLRPSELQQHLPRVAELPFDSERKRMTTVHRAPQAAQGQTSATYEDILRVLQAPYVAFTKGAVDGLLEHTASVWENDQVVALDAHWRERIQMANDQMAQNGMRVLGLAMRPYQTMPESEALESDLILIGLVGMIDPPRPEVKEAVRICRRAGMRPVMITGDHPLTARFIAYELGITDNGRVKTGRDLESMSQEELEQIVNEVAVYARVTPEHKLRIVEALQRGGQVVAMTGDGVNDSPALKRADIGIAMGITGTDVSKEAAEMVLIDDNFATIVAAVEEGRVIYDNVRRFVKFSIAGNIGKVIVMLLAPLIGINVALLPLQLLWLNLLTDGLLGLGLGVERPEKGTMQRPPRSPEAGLLSEGLLGHVTWVGVLIGALALLIGGYYFRTASGSVWQTMIFTSLAFMQVGQAMASRSSEASLFSLGLGSNMTLVILALITLALQLLVIYVPFLDQFFEVTPLSAGNLLVALAAAAVVVVAIELEKWIKRRA